MDTTAYLTSQGWLGTGHGLNPAASSISKPILIPQKQNVFGVGKKRHDSNADQWWVRTFDDVLKAVNTPQSEKANAFAEQATQASASANRATWNMGIRPSAPGTTGKISGLYRNFVQGESLGGTLESKAVASVARENSEGKGQEGEAPSQGELVSAGVETKEQRKQRREEKRARKKTRREAREAVQKVRREAIENPEIQRSEAQNDRRKKKAKRGQNTVIRS